MRVYVLDECHMLTREAQNALLKIIEEPPVGVYFILCMTEPRGMIRTIRSRCVWLELKALNRATIMTLLKNVCDAEGIKFREAVLEEVTTLSKGDARDALMS